MQDVDKYPVSHMLQQPQKPYAYIQARLYMLNCLHCQGPLVVPLLRCFGVYALM